MHKYITLFFSLTLILSACKGGNAPAGVIGHDRMISLLTEVHIEDGRIYNVSQLPDSLYKYGADKYMDLFKKFHTDSAQFKRSLKYYTTQPVELEAIYDQVFANLKHKTDSMIKSQQKHALPKK